jgi:hypothetical protein
MREGAEILLEELLHSCVLCAKNIIQKDNGDFISA